MAPNVEEVVQECQQKMDEALDVNGILIRLTSHLELTLENPK